LAADSRIGDEHTSVAEVRALLAAARYDLEQTTVRAPAAGQVAYLTLRPGQRVANLPLRSWIAFIDAEKSEVVMTVQQYALRHVKPNQPAEVTFKQYPGQVFKAKVQRIAYTSSSAQLSPSGQLAPTSQTEAAEPYGVVLGIEDPEFNRYLLAGGAKGSAAIYTNQMKATHVIRRVMIRMDAWLNYVIP
jgi:multidrug resistance efflux pump